jgi:hypothetical protein
MRLLRCGEVKHLVAGVFPCGLHLIFTPAGGSPRQSAAASRPVRPASPAATRRQACTAAPGGPRTGPAAATSSPAALIKVGSLFGDVTARRSGDRRVRGMGVSAGQPQRSPSGCGVRALLMQAITSPATSVKG